MRSINASPETIIIPLPPRLFARSRALGYAVLTNALRSFCATLVFSVLINRGNSIPIAAIH